MRALPTVPSSRLLTSWHILAHPMRWPFEWRDRYGDPFLVKALNGDVVVTGRPDLVQKVFAAPPDTFAPFVPDVVAPLAGASSVLVATGEKHKRDRKLLMPPFHGDRMRTWGEAIAATTSERLSRIPVGGAFTMYELGQRIALEVIVRVVFGVEEEARVDEYSALMTRALQSAHPSFLFAPALQTRMFPPFARFRRDMDAAVAALRDQIARARARPERGLDVLSLLLQARDEEGRPMSDDELVDQLRTLLLAGHETTAISLAWAVHHVHRHPEVKERLLEELRAGEGTPESFALSPYLRAVCDEALRLHPIVPDVMRTLVKPFELDGHVLEPGVTLGLSLVLTHRDPELYPEPERFRPERFLEKTFAPSAYYPFGGGARRCVGAAFAHYEMRIALATLLLEGAFELLDEGEVQPVRRNLTLVPKGGVRMRRIAAAGARARAA